MDPLDYESSEHGRLFGKNLAWQRLAESLGARFIPARPASFVSRQMLVPAGNWTLAVDEGSQPEGLRVRAVYVRCDHLRFTVRVHKYPIGRGLDRLLRRPIFGRLVQLGDPVFDDRCFLQCNDLDAVRRLFEDARLRNLLLAQAPGMLQVANQKQAPPNAEVRFTLYQQSLVPNRFDEARMRGALELAHEVLTGLMRIGSAAAN